MIACNRPIMLLERSLMNLNHDLKAHSTADMETLKNTLRELWSGALGQG